VEVKVPQAITIKVSLIKSVHLPANCSAKVPVQVREIKGTVLLEPKESLDQALLYTLPERNSNE